MRKTTLTVSDIHELARDCLIANGCDTDNADAVAETIAAAERDGCPGHGLIRLPGYVAALKSGKVDGAARPKIEQVAPSALRVDASGGFAPLALQSSRDALIDLAKAQGVAVLGLVRVHHFAALRIEVEALAEAGLSALACTAYMPAMPPPGGAEKFFGTNPLAFGWPRVGKPPKYALRATASSRGLH